MRHIRHVVVAVPARNEQALLSWCLEGIALAREHLVRTRPVPCDIVLALDGCTDGSARVAEAFDVEVVVLDGVGVGRARDAGVRAGLARSGVAPEHVWVACTDADTRVPVTWLTRQLVLADTAVDLVVGTVEPRGTVDPAVMLAWQERHHLDEGHPHVHGANLGFRASRYLRVGGFRPLGMHEDVDLVARLRADGARWCATDTTRAWTSARCSSRVDAGFAGYLARLDEEVG